MSPLETFELFHCLHYIYFVYNLIVSSWGIWIMKIYLQSQVNDLNIQKFFDEIYITNVSFWGSGIILNFVKTLYLDRLEKT